MRTISAKKSTKGVVLKKSELKIPSQVPKDLLEKIEKIRKRLNKHILEREGEIDGIILSVLSGLSIMFLGNVGTAKTHLIRMAGQMVGLSVFDILLSETTKPEAIFGPTDIPALADGNQWTKTKGYAPESEILFFDEIFKANSIVLNQLLWLINEKEYRNGDKGIVKCDIKSVMVASNEIPTDQSLAALYDRLTFRFEVKYLNEKGNILKMIDGSLTAPEEAEHIMTRDEVNLLRAMARKVVVPKEVQEVVVKIRDQVQLACKSEISDRRLVNSFKAIQAQALIHGRMEATVEDTEVVSNIFWESPEQQTRVQAIALSHASSDIADILSYEELAESVWQTAKASGEMDTAYTKLADLYKRVKNFESKSGKLIANRIKGRMQRAEDVLNSRKEFVLVKIESETERFYKVSNGTAHLWTKAQMRSIGMRWTRNMQYWWINDTRKKIAQRVRDELGVEPVFHTLTTEKKEK